MGRSRDARTCPALRLEFRVEGSGFGVGGLSFGFCVGVAILASGLGFGNEGSGIGDEGLGIRD